MEESMGSLEPVPAKALVGQSPWQHREMKPWSWHLRRMCMEMPKLELSCSLPVH